MEGIKGVTVRRRTEPHERNEVNFRKKDNSVCLFSSDNTERVCRLKLEVGVEDGKVKRLKKTRYRRPDECRDLRSE